MISTCGHFIGYRNMLPSSLNNAMATRNFKHSCNFNLVCCPYPVDVTFHSWFTTDFEFLWSSLVFFRIQADSHYNAPNDKEVRGPKMGAIHRKYSFRAQIAERNEKMPFEQRGTKATYLPCPYSPHYSDGPLSSCWKEEVIVVWGSCKGAGWTFAISAGQGKTSPLPAH